MAQGPDRRMWFTRTGQAAIGVMDKVIGEPHYHPLKPLDGKPRDPFAIALGPDGNLWFTEPAGGRIGRITPAGEVTPFQLREGYRPLELTAGTDGRMLFTLEDRNLIGSIRAVPGAGASAVAHAAGSAAGEAGAAGEPRAAGPAVPGPSAAGLAGSEPAAEPKAAAPAKPDSVLAEWAGPLYKPRPERRKAMTDLERRERDLARLKLAEQRFQARLAVEPAAQAAPAEAKAGRQAAAPGRAAGSRQEHKGDSKAAGASRRDPAERLAALNVNLPPGMVEYILAKHGHDRNPHKSQFQKQYSTPDGLRGLIADGLEQAGELARERCSNALGRFITLCPVPKVGWTNGSRGFQSSDWLKIVYARHFNGEDYEYDVISAFPVAGP